MLAIVLAIAGGLIALVAGAHLLVGGASRLARALGMPALVVGLTIVAFGTSAPELVVSASSALGGRTDIALGNVIGSNVFNVLFILGVSAAIVPLTVAQKLVRVDVPVMIAVAVLVLALGLDRRIGRLEGVALLALLAAYTVFCLRSVRRESADVRSEYEREYGGARPRKARSLALYLLAIVGGLAALVLGARWFVAGAVQLAQALGLSELVIGLTIVAAGTSLPEVATSIVAAVRGERDIAVGNVVGSNVFNVLGVLGASAAIAPGGVHVAPSTLAFDVPVMIAASAACLPICLTGHTIARWEGWLLLAYYVAYATYLVLAAQRHDALHGFTAVMAGFAIPLTVVGLTAAWIRGSAANSQRAPGTRA